MIIGGWCLGTAWLALVIARRAVWPAVLCPVIYLALFGLLETGVLVAFRDRLLLASALAWIYVASLAGTCLFAIAALLEGWRKRPVVVAVGRPTGAATLAFVVFFILFVGFLGLYGLLAVSGMRGLNAGIFPEVLTMFTLRAFGAFYLALALCVIPLLWARGQSNLLTHGYAAYGLLVLI